MTKYVAPIITGTCQDGEWFWDDNHDPLKADDIATMLTEYLETKKRQYVCDHIEHDTERWNGGRSFKGVFANCPLCGARL